MEKSFITQYTMNEDIFPQLQEDLKEYKRVLILHGIKALESLEGRLEGILEGKEKEYIHYGKECSFNQIDKLLVEIEKYNLYNNFFDIVISVGGGKAVDTSKVIADKLNLPIFIIPTVPSTCASTSALSVIYKDTHEYDTLYFLKQAPNRTYVDLKVLRAAPNKFIWAGIGDTLAKYYEMIFKMGEEKSFNYSTTLAKNICLMCKESILKSGVESMNNPELTESFKEVVGTIVISTGMVSNLIDFKYNGALAHGIFNALTLIKRVEEEHLHGEVIAFGILVQLLIEGKKEDYEELCEFYKKIDLPTKLEDVAIFSEYLEKKEDILKAILSDEMASTSPLPLTNEELASFLEK